MMNSIHILKPIIQAFFRRLSRLFRVTASILLTAMVATNALGQGTRPATPLRLYISSSGIITGPHVESVEHFALTCENSTGREIKVLKMNLASTEAGAILSQTDFEFSAIGDGQVVREVFRVKSSGVDAADFQTTGPSPPLKFKVSATFDGASFDSHIETVRGSLSGKLVFVPLILTPLPGETVQGLSAHSVVGEALAYDPFARSSLSIDILKDPRLARAGLEPSRVLKAVKKGTIEPVVYLSGGYGELGVEGIVRDILRQQKQNMELTGGPARTAVMELASASSPHLPQLLLKSGIRGMIALVGNEETSCQPGDSITVSPDGSRLDTYVWNRNTEITLPIFPDKNALKEMALALSTLRGPGNFPAGSVIEIAGRNSGLSPLLWNNNIRAPRMSIGVASSCFKSHGLGRKITRINEMSLPASSGPVPLDTGLKRSLALIAALVRDAETWATLSWMNGKDFPQGEIEYCRSLMSALETRLNARDPADGLIRLRRCGTVALDVLRSSQEYLLRQAQLRPLIPKAEDSTAVSCEIAVFNSCPWKRTGLVRVTLPDGSGLPGRVIDPEGRSVPFSLLDTGGKTDVVFIGEHMPATGFRIYSLGPFGPKPDGPAASPAIQSPEKGKLAIENEYFRVMSERPGAVKSIYDKRLKRELLGPVRHGGMELFAGLGADTDASLLWRASDGAESSDVRKDTLSERLVFHGTCRGARWQEEIILWNGMPRIDVEVRFFDTDDRIPNMKMGLDLIRRDCSVKSGYSDTFRLVDAAAPRKWEQVIELVPGIAFKVIDNSGVSRTLSNNASSVSLFVEPGGISLRASASRMVDVFARAGLETRAVTVHEGPPETDDKSVNLFLGNRFTRSSGAVASRHTSSSKEFFFKPSIDGQPGSLWIPTQAAMGVAEMSDSFVVQPKNDAWSMSIASSDLLDYSLTSDGTLLLGLTSDGSTGSDLEMLRTFRFSISAGDRTNPPMRRATELLSPMRVVLVEPSRADLLREGELLLVTPDRSILTALKPSTASGGTREAIMRVVNNAEDAAGPCVLVLPGSLKVWKANLIEEKWRPLDVLDGRVSFACPPNTIETIVAQSDWAGEDVRTDHIGILAHDRPLYTRYWLTGEGQSLLRKFVSVTFVDRVVSGEKVIRASIRITNHDLVNNAAGSVRFAAPAGWRISPPHGIMYDLLPGGSVIEKVRIVTSGRGEKGIVRANYDVKDMTFYDSLIVGEPDLLQVKPMAPKVVAAPGRTVKVSFQITNLLEQPLTAAVALTGGPATWGDVDPEGSFLDIRPSSMTVKLGAARKVNRSFDVTVMAGAPYGRIPIRIKTMNDGNVDMTDPIVIEISG
ncbi:hypothetical protein ACFL1X_08495 [Candidatus Hydrogenedentota bacterium]